ncbi:hypothetical protein [Streptomyces sp. NPDC059479]|uniref:hypothetical protein n=1 Tax=Streptomyces sp. NPDC059479 TaxID=3346848 RepID=UPI0036C1B373
MRTAAGKPGGSASWRRTFTAHTLMEVGGRLRDRDDGRQSARELKAVAETIIAPGYQGRALIELLQKAHAAAYPSRALDGRVEILFGEDEGGVLYVANGGNPLREGDFTALCGIGLSGKRPDDGIGHKGVLQLTEAPETEKQYCT